MTDRIRRVGTRHYEIDGPEPIRSDELLAFAAQYDEGPHGLKVTFTHTTPGGIDMSGASAEEGSENG